MSHLRRQGFKVRYSGVLVTVGLRARISFLRVRRRMALWTALFERPVISAMRWWLRAAVSWPRASVWLQMWRYMRKDEGDLSWPTRSRIRTSRTYSSSSATKDSIRWRVGRGTGGSPLLYSRGSVRVGSRSEDTSVNAARMSARATHAYGCGASLLGAEDELVAVLVFEDCGGAPGFYFGRGYEFYAFGF